MTIEIHPITRSDIPAVARIIQEAFDTDPYNHWVFDRKTPGAFNASRNLASLTAKCEWGMRHALFTVAKDSSKPDDAAVVGVGMWMLPRNTSSSPPTWTEWWDEYVLWFRQGWNVLRFRGRGGLNVKRYWIWKERQAEVQRELWTDPEGYYFCNIVVVDPACQGQGVARKLIGEVLERADREGRKAYLESSRRVPNVAIYEKFGFKLAKEMRCEEGGDVCDLFCMIRDPKSQESEGQA